MIGGRTGSVNAAETIRIGTRGSLLARTQTEWVAERLRAAHPGLALDIRIIQTTGDLRRDVPFAAVGTKGMFVKEIEQALLEGRIDIGIHSLKDMPSELPEGLELACVPVRENPFDALLTRSGGKSAAADNTQRVPAPFGGGLRELPEGALVGTSSVRRSAQLRHYRPDLRIEELRGNLDTRIRKLDAGDYDAIVLAAAGLNRLGWGDRITEQLSPDVCVPAAGQGALALETRTGDAETLRWLAAIHDRDSADAIATERAFLTALGGGCSVPAGAFAEVRMGRISLIATIAAPDGSLLLRAADSDDRSCAAALGERIANRLLSQGGRELLQR